MGERSRVNVHQSQVTVEFVLPSDNEKTVLGLQKAAFNIDKRWAPLFNTDAEIFDRPGLHLTRNDEPQTPWMNWKLSFLAVVPARARPAVLVRSFAVICDEAEARLNDVPLDDRQRVEPLLLQFAKATNYKDVYSFNFSVGCREVLNLNKGNTVQEYPAGDTNLVDWEDRKLCNEVDGPIFVCKDDHGLTSWAGIKRVSPYAQDIQVETREDERGKGLGKLVASHAIARILEENITPYYAYAPDNQASEALAKSLGFRPYGFAVVAEQRETAT